MTPEQLNAVINAWVAVDAAVNEYGPGLTVAAGAWITWRTTRRLADRIRTHRELRRIENYANHPGARRQHNPARKEKP